MDPVMLSGWIGFGLLLLGFVGVTGRWFSARGWFYPLTLVGASIAYGYMNYSLFVWPGFWSNIVFGIIGGIAWLAAVGRNRLGKGKITDEELDEECDKIEEESDEL